jgi:hypothetical protein
MHGLARLHDKAASAIDFCILIPRPTSSQGSRTASPDPQISLTDPDSHSGNRPDHAPTLLARADEMIE